MFVLQKQVLTTANIGSYRCAYNKVCLTRPTRQAKSEDPAMDIAIIGAGNVGRRSPHRSCAPATPSRSPPAIQRTPARSPRPPAPGSRTRNLEAVATTADRRRRRRRSRARRTIAAEIGEAVPARSSSTRRIGCHSARRPGHRHDHLERRGARRPAPRGDASSRRSTRCSPRTRPTRSPRASSSTATSPPTTPQPRLQVLELVGSIGLRPVDVGPLARSRQLEGLAFLNITLNIANGGTWQSGWKLVGAPASVPVAA